MRQIKLSKGLDVPLTGEPLQKIGQTKAVKHVGLLGDDFIGMKPTMEVAVGERVKTGQLLFEDKKNKGVRFTSPATGKITEINRGKKRKFESLVIACEDDDFVFFLEGQQKADEDFSAEKIRTILIESSLWTAFRTRPYGRIPAVDSVPAAIFITAMDTRPLAPSAALILQQYEQDFLRGLSLVDKLTRAPTYLCVSEELPFQLPSDGTIETVCFTGPHPAGLASTHIHFLQPADEHHVSWHIDYQDVIGIGTLFNTGHLPTERIIAIGGPASVKPQLVKTRIGADIHAIVRDHLLSSPNRIISGSPLDGRQVKDEHRFLGRYHNQVTILPEEDGRGLFSWAAPGMNRFSFKHLFLSTFTPSRKFPLNTALWGGKRAIFPIDSYDRVMPLDIIALSLLKSLYSTDSEKAKQLGALELIEEDLALLSFVCPGKNDFGPLLRQVLTDIEMEG